jgi:diaminopropionate ammonia-lyase
MISVDGKLNCFNNPRKSLAEAYPDELKAIASLQKSRNAVREISRWPAYAPTPLHNLENLANNIQVSKLWYKDESHRFGLKSFKALGGAYAVARQLQLRVKEVTGVEPEMQALLERKFEHIVSQVIISCATDGNHGRSVAWGCQLFGCGCVIYIHRNVSEPRQQAKEAFGAKVIRISGNYDDSVRQAAADAEQYGRTIVSDTSYAGYMDIPKDVALGYTVLLAEAVEQMGDEIPTHVFIQGGVGGLASAVCAYFWELWGKQRPRFIVVEPEQANCLQQSARAGKPVVVEGDHDTLMAGLACGEVSLLAWKILKPGVDDFLTVNELVVPHTMRLLARGVGGDQPVEAGESAVAGLAALITARNSSELSKKLALDESSRIFILGTEGATDPELHQRLIKG